MKVFWVIAYDHYYPDAGLRDVRGTFLTREEAEEYAATLKDFDYVEIEDVSEMLGLERHSGVES